VRVLLISDRRVTAGVLNITAAAWTASFQWWRSSDITRTQNVSEYMLVLALCLVIDYVDSILENTNRSQDRIRDTGNSIF